MAASLCLVLGDEELLANRAVAAAIASVRAREPGAEVQEHAGAEMSAGDLMAAVSPSLFGAARVVVVRDAQDLRKDAAAALLDYVKSPEPDVTLVVVHAGGVKGRALADALRAAGAAVTSAAKLKPGERVEFTRSEVRRLGGRCTEDAAQALVAAVGHDLRELAAACSQLVADTSGTIDRAAVARYYRGQGDVRGYNISDAVMAGNLAGALEGLRWALRSGVDPVPLASALSDGVRAFARVASAPGSEQQVAALAGVPAWKVRNIRSQARAWSPEALAAATRIAAEGNAAVRGGAEDRAFALEKAIFGIAAARAGGRATA